MDDYTLGNYGLKIVEVTSMAKCISILRKYNHISMSSLIEAINKNYFVLSCSCIDTPNIRKLRKCYDELNKNGIKSELYDNDEPTTRELITNLLVSHAQIELEVMQQIDEEVAAEDENE